MKTRGTLAVTADPTTTIQQLFVRHQSKVLERRQSDRRLSREVSESLAASLPEDELEERRLMPLLDCIDELPPKSQEVIRLRYFSEHGPGEIAAMLGRSVVGVNAALVKPRGVLRECVTKSLGSQ